MGLGETLMNELTISRRQLYRYNKGIGMSKYNAAISAGYPLTMAEKYRLVTDTVEFVDLFERRGMTRLKKVEHAIQGMNATKVVAVESDETTEKGKKVYVNVEVPDWPARHKYFETMLKLCKDIQQTAGDTNVVIFDLADRIREAREKADRGLRVMNAHMADNIITVETQPAETSGDNGDG